MAVSKNVAEDMMNWLEADDNLRQNPEAARLKQCLMEMAAAKRRRLSSSSSASDKSNGSSIRRQNDPTTGSVHPVINAARYKTELCRSYSENGYCRYGDKCQFAHGASELRSTVRHPRYKTELCKEYHTTGFCAYGSRCNFIHNDMEYMEHSVQPAPIQSPLLVALPTSGPVFQVDSSFWTLRMLGSTADSPPQSVTDSPSPSPTAMFFDSAFDIFPGLVAGTFPFQTTIGSQL